MKNRSILIVCLVCFAGCNSKGNQAIINTEKETLHLTTRTRILADSQKQSFDVVDSIQVWKENETAVIVCDMWDKHWCPSATARVAELAPEMDNLITIMRNKGLKIVHAPSECIDYYKDHPGRKELLEYSGEEFLTLADGVKKLPSEANATWPIDDSDEGCDSPGANFYYAWTKQIDTIPIDEKDLIGDNGPQMGAYFKKHGIKNVIMMGVHTNMCVMHRSFGLRFMKRMGMNLVLVRDMTDLMYNPESYPYTSHFNGLNLMVEYIEKYICPTITSSDFTGKAPFVFAETMKGK